MIRLGVRRRLDGVRFQQIWLSSHFGAYPATVTLPRFCAG